MLGQRPGAAPLPSLTNASNKEGLAPSPSRAASVRSDPTVSQGFLHIINSVHDPFWMREGNGIPNNGSLYSTVTWVIVGGITFAVLLGYFEWKDRRRKRRRERMSDPPTRLPVESWVIILSMDVLSAASLDLYFPLLPVIMAEFNVSAYLVTSTLAINCVAKAIGHIVMGLLSERWGRQPVFFLGSALYSVCALGCSSAPSVTWLLILRACQGFGEASGDLSGAVIIDVLAPSERMHMNSIRWFLRFLVPAVACSIASPVVSFLGWRMFMVVLAAWGCFNNVATAWLLQETRPPEAVLPSAAGASFKAGVLSIYYLLSSPLMVCCFLSTVVLYAMIYSTLGTTAVIFDSYLQVQHSLVAVVQTSVPLITLAFPALLVGQLKGESSPMRMLRSGMSAQMCALCISLVLGYWAYDVSQLLGQAAVLGMIWLMMTVVGIVMVPLEIVFLEQVGHMAGLASGVQAMLRIVLGPCLVIAVLLVVEVYREKGAFLIWGAMMGCCQAMFWGVIVRWYREPRNLKKQGAASHEETFEETVIQGEDYKPTLDAAAIKEIVG